MKIPGAASGDHPAFHFHRFESPAGKGACKPESTQKKQAGKRRDGKHPLPVMNSHGS
jgi:hypothetical protein